MRDLQDLFSFSSSHVATYGVFSSKIRKRDYSWLGRCCFLQFVVLRHCTLGCTDWLLIIQLSKSPFCGQLSPWEWSSLYFFSCEVFLCSLYCYIFSFFVWNEWHFCANFKTSHSLPYSVKAKYEITSEVMVCLMVPILFLISISFQWVTS